MPIRQLGRVLLALGVALAIASLAADSLGVGGQPGIGWKQLLGLVVGAVALIGGFACLLAASGGAGAPARLRSRESLRRLGELFVLAGFALAQPLFDVFSDGADIFVFRGATALDILVFTLVVVLAPALGLWLIEWAVSIAGERPLRLTHVALLGVLAALFGIQALKDLTGVRGPVAVALALAFGAGLAALYWRRREPRLWLAYLIPAPLLFAGLFLFASPVSDLLGGQESEARAVSAGSGAPVVMVVFDEFPLASLIGRDGSLQADQYPHFAELARHSTWYRNTATNAWYTPFAVPAILSGRYPKKESLATAANYPVNLFTALGGSYQLHVSELLSLCPERLCPDKRPPRSERLTTLGEDAAKTWGKIVAPNDPDEDITAQLVERDDRVAATATGGTDQGFFGLTKNLQGNNPARFQRFLSELEPPEARPPLHFLHILAPHVPWRYLPNGTTYPGQPVSVGGDGWSGHPWPIAVSRQRHLLQVRYVDRLVGAMIDRLKEVGLWDRALIVITADHGAAFRSGSPRRDYDRRTVHEVAWVPLFVKAPGQRAGRVSDRKVQLIDVLPTIADILNLRLPGEVDGISALGPERRSAKVPYLFSPSKGVMLDANEGERLVRRDSMGAFAPLGNDRLRLFRIGEHGELVGRRVDELPGLRPSPTRAGVENAGRYRDVDPSSGVLPAYVVGRLDAPPSPAADVAVAVNGVIGAVSATWPQDGVTRFAGVVPPELFRRGANEVTLYLVERRAGRLALRPLQRS